jgi:hypothetical protein
MLALMDQIEKNDSLYQRCTPMFYEMLAAERKAHRDNYRALSAIAAKIAAAKNYDDYKKLKTIEDEVLGAIETQKIKDQTDVAKLRFHVSEGEAACSKRHRESNELASKICHPALKCDSSAILRSEARAGAI